MPCNYALYPPNWKTEIRPRILKRAGNRCEFCGAENGKPHPETGSKVILTIAHLDHDRDNREVSDDRLRALCQRCHLRYDRKRDDNEKLFTVVKAKVIMERPEDDYFVDVVVPADAGTFFWMDLENDPKFKGCLEVTPVKEASR